MRNPIIDLDTSHRDYAEAMTPENKAMLEELATTTTPNSKEIITRPGRPGSRRQARCGWTNADENPPDAYGAWIIDGDGRYTWFRIRAGDESGAADEAGEREGR